MSRSAEIEIWFGEEERTFRLGIKQLRKLQERCADKIRGERGPQTILRALSDGSWLADDVIQPIRLGLIGAGVKEEDAAKLVADRIEEKDGGLAECVLIAMAVLSAAIVGAPRGDDVDLKGGDPPGEAKGATSDSSSPPSTDKEQPAASALAKSMN